MRVAYAFAEITDMTEQLLDFRATIPAKRITDA